MFGVALCQVLYGHSKSQSRKTIGGANFWRSGSGHQNGFDSIYGRAEALLSAISFVVASLAPASEPVNIGNLYT